jgi:hypothetical protein
MTSRQWTRLSGTIAMLLVAAAAGVWPGAGVHAQKRWGADYFLNVPLTTHTGELVHFCVA